MKIGPAFLISAPGYVAGVFAYQMWPGNGDWLGAIERSYFALCGMLVLWVAIKWWNREAACPPG